MPGFTTQNRWLDPNASVGAFSRMAGQIDNSNQPRWHYNTTPIIYDAIGAFSAGFIEVPYNHVPTNGCNTFVWWTSGSIFSGYREEALGDIVQNDQQYEELLQEYSYYGFEYLYDMLTAEPEIMDSEDPSEDQVYYNWMQGMSESNIAKFYSVLQAIDEGDLMQAASVNNGIVPANDLEQNRKTVNSYYLSHYVRGIAFGFEDSVSLAQIALLTPYQGGTAVFGARVMLRIDADDHGLSYKTEPSDQITKPSFALYPNPATQQTTLQLNNGLLSADAKIYILDVLGRTVTTLQAGEQSEVLLNLNHLPHGIYVVKVFENGKESFVEKLIVN
jgi:hypothetical protein